MGVSERLQQLRANFHEHPVRDWLLVAIGAAALVVAVLTLLRTGSGGGTATPVDPTGPGSPVGGGGGSGGGGNPGPIQPIPLPIGPSQPTPGPDVYGPVGVSVGLGAAQGFSDNAAAQQQQQQQQEGNAGTTAASGIVASLGQAIAHPLAMRKQTVNNPTISSQLAHRGRAEPGDVSSALHTAPTLNQVQTAPAHQQADSEQQPVVRSGAIAKGRR